MELFISLGLLGSSSLVLVCWAQSRTPSFVNDFSFNASLHISLPYLPNLLLLFHVLWSCLETSLPLVHLVYKTTPSLRLGSLLFLCTVTQFWSVSTPFLNSSQYQFLLSLVLWNMFVFLLGCMFHTVLISFQGGVSLSEIFFLWLHVSHGFDQAVRHWLHVFI
jgi:hypothetical protein